MLYYYLTNLLSKIKYMHTVAISIDRECSDTDNNITSSCAGVEDPRLCSTHSSFEGRRAQTVLREEAVRAEPPSFGHAQYRASCSRHEDTGLVFPCSPEVQQHAAPAGTLTSTDPPQLPAPSATRRRGGRPPPCGPEAATGAGAARGGVGRRDIPSDAAREAPGPKRARCPCPPASPPAGIGGRAGGAWRCPCAPLRRARGGGTKGI